MLVVDLVATRKRKPNSSHKWTQRFYRKRTFHDLHVQVCTEALDNFRLCGGSDDTFKIRISNKSLPNSGSITCYAEVNPFRQCTLCSVLTEDSFVSSIQWKVTLGEVRLVQLFSKFPRFVPCLSLHGTRCNSCFTHRSLDEVNSPPCHTRLFETTIRKRFRSFEISNFHVLVGLVNFYVVSCCSFSA